MASGLLSSIQSLSSKLLEAFRGDAARLQDKDSTISHSAKSVSDDLKKLSRMLARIDAVLLDAEERQIHDRSVQLWLDELRGVAYQAEDVLDEFHYEVLKSIVDTGDAAIQMYHGDRGSKRKFSEMCTSSSLSSSLSAITNISIPHEMSQKIRSIKENFEEISDARRNLHLREDDGSRLVTDPQIRPPTSSSVDESRIFGREKEKEKIISLLNPSNDSDFMVLPIVGMGGLGKTTLAQLIYNDSIFGQLFQKKAWVSVSEDFDLVRLNKAIIESMSDGPCQFSELSKLQDVLNEKLRGVTVFLVLDDVWNEKRNLWEHFLVAFHGAKTVRILVTTRVKLVAKIVQTISYFPLDYLPKAKCWSLFQHFAFDNKVASENSNLLKIGHSIVKKCNGLPLAIKVLGGMLRHEKDEKKWREALESDISEIDETGEIMPALWLSYRKLPLHLRPCLLFLSMFPKGTQLKKDKVVRFWMAQGYINGNARSKKTLEKIGSEYLDELQGRSLVDCWDDNRCCLHDLIHDLASSISQRTNGPITEDDQQWISSCKVHHLYLTRKDELSGFLELNNYGTIRTIVKECPRSYIIDSSIFCNIACVRALELSAMLMTLGKLKYFVLPDVLGMFKHLRYLSIEGDWMRRLPESLCLLYHLQSLHLNCPNIQELPEKIKNLVNLRYFGLSSHKIKQLPESVCLLCNLHTLTLEGCDKFNKLPSNIEQLTNLHVLNLNHCPSISMPFGIGKLPNLTTLSGQFDVKEGDTIGGLGELEDMNQLSGVLCISGLKNIDNVGYSRKANLISKPNLRHLILNFEETAGKSILKGVLYMAVSSSTKAKNDSDETIQEGVLESLQPHGKLGELEILHYRGRIFPLCYFPCLIIFRLKVHLCPNVREVIIPQKVVVLEINACGCEEIMFSSQSYLKIISIFNCRALINIHFKNGDLPVLESISLSGCPNLLLPSIIPQQLKYIDIQDCSFQEINFSSLFKLQKISISSCRELVAIHYKNGDLPALENISLYGCPNLLTPLVMPKELKEINIHHCGFQELNFSSHSKLQSISINNCRELVSIYYENGGFPVLRKVRLSDCPRLLMFSAIIEDFKQLGIRYCGFQEIKFSSEMGASLFEDFKQLGIRDCGSISNHMEFLSESVQIERIRVENVNWYIPASTISLHDCPKLRSFSAIPAELKRLEIHNCGFCEIMLPSRCERLKISFCVELISMYWTDGGLNALTQIVTFVDCPQLELLTIPKEVKKLDVISCGIHEIIFPSESRIDSIHISHCPNISLHIPDGVLPLLEKLSVKSCPQICNALTIANQLKELDIIDCNVPEICIMPNSMLQKLFINSCIRLTTIKGLQAQCLLLNLLVSQCPILQFPMDGVIHPMMELIHIYDCPRIDLGSQRKGCFYKKDTLVKGMVVSRDKMNSLSHSISLLENSSLFLMKEDPLEVIRSLEHVSLGLVSQYIQLYLPSVVQLEILNCSKIIAVTGLNNLNNLKHLVISECPELCEWKDRTLPSSLQSLSLLSCCKLSCVPLRSVDNHPRKLKVIIGGCPLVTEW